MANRPASLYFVMAILGRDAFDEFFERWCRFGDWRDDNFAVSNRQVDLRIFVELGFFGEWLRDANGQAVAPLLNARFHVYTKYTRGSEIPGTLLAG